MKKLISLALVCVINSAYAQYGQPDPAFGNNGIIATNVGSNISNFNSSGQQVLSLPDGSMYFLVRSAGLTFIEKNSQTVPRI